jgi:hypothetical protein
MTLGLYRQVAPPRLDPLPYGLLSVAQLVPDGDPHWMAGTWFQPDTCDASKTIQADCPVNPALDWTKTPTSVGITSRGADAFMAYSYIDCSPVGQFADYEARTRAALERGASRAIERTFWTGLTTAPAASGASIYPHLASNSQVFALGNEILLQPSAVVVSGSGSAGLATSIVEAVGLLEEAMGSCYPGVPTLHMPRRAFAHLSSHFILNLNGAFANTPSGSLINAGGGNPNIGPDGSTPSAGQVWIYATGALQYRRGEARATSTINQALRRDVNSMRFIMEQPYQFNWDCCLFAVRVDLTGNN